MTTDQAQSAVTLSAFTVAGVFAYRKLVEPKPKGTSPPTSHFVVGFGVVFVSLAVIAQAAPELGGMFAVLVAVGDLLANGQAIAKDITNALGVAKTATSGAAVSTATPASPVSF
jgi:hypothetical protein